jgi:periplasmic protein TonB
VRWDSPFVLATAGTLAIHLMLAVAGDALVVIYPPQPDPPPPPRIEIVDIELPPIVKPPPPAVKPPEPAPQHDVPPPPKAPAPQRIRTPAPPEPPPTVPPPPPDTPPDPSPGGAPVISEPDLAPAATGVGVAVGPRNTGHVGRGGTGTGTGAGEGAGSAEAPKPMSVATIKTRAMPHGDYSYQETKDYPLEAKQLGIEGKIRVKLVVDEHGLVKSAVLLNRLGHGLDELALRRAKEIVFDPAKDTDDHAVASVVVWTFDLTLPR